MEKQDMILVALAAGGPNATFSPVQVQKLLFLIDREAKLVDGPHFDFKPYNYGPFDRTVYDELKSLSKDKLVEIFNAAHNRTYILTPQGYDVGSKKLDLLPDKASSFVKRAAEWVRELTFQQLVAAIYHHYPDMKKNSVFVG